MKEITKILIGIVVVAGILLGTGFMFGRVTTPQTHVAGGLNEFQNSWTNTATSSKESVGATSVSILATSTSRLWAHISNISAFPLFCRFDGDKAAAVNQGIFINASSTYEINANNLYQGSVQCVASGGTALVFVEANQQ